MTSVTTTHAAVGPHHFFDSVVLNAMTPAVYYKSSSPGGAKSLLPKTFVRHSGAYDAAKFDWGSLLKSRKWNTKPAPL